MGELVEHLRARWRRVRRSNSVPMLFSEQMRRAKRQRQFAHINTFLEQFYQQNPVAFNLCCAGVAAVVWAVCWAVFDVLFE